MPNASATDAPSSGGPPGGYRQIILLLATQTEHEPRLINSALSVDGSTSDRTPGTDVYLLRDHIDGLEIRIAVKSRTHDRGMLAVAFAGFRPFLVRAPGSREDA